MVTAKRYNRFVKRKGRCSRSRPLTLFAGPSAEVNYGRLLVSGSSLGSSARLCHSRPQAGGALKRGFGLCRKNQAIAAAGVAPASRRLSRGRLASPPPFA